jgi:hypothetical protein
MREGRRGGRERRVREGIEEAKKEERERKGKRNEEGIRNYVRKARKERMEV